MKFKTGYDTCTVISNLKADDIRNAKRFCPEALILKDKDKCPIFKVDMDYLGSNGDMSNLGIKFNGETNDGYAFYTFSIPTMPTEPDELKKLIKDTFGMTLANLTKVEDQVTEALAEVNGVLNTLDDAIEIAE